MTTNERIARATELAHELERLAYRIKYDASPQELKRASVVLRLTTGLRRKLDLWKEKGK